MTVDLGTTGRATDSAIVHPRHYNSHPSGVECITVARHHSFNIGSVFKYLWRAGLKVTAGQQTLDQEIEDMEKAVFYLQDEIEAKKALRDGRKIIEN